MNILSQLKIDATIDVIEENGVALLEGDLIISNHKNKGSFVVLKYGQFNITVNAEVLKESIQRCSNYSEGKQ